MFKWSYMYIPIILLAALTLEILFAQQAEAKDLCLGTFSNFRFNNEGGDIQGVEVKVVYTRLGNQAAVQFSEGEPGPLALAPVKCDGTRVSLKIPKADGRAAVTFEGVVSKDRLVGELVYETGGREKLSLPRRKGYWD